MNTLNILKISLPHQISNKKSDLDTISKDKYPCFIVV